MDMCSNKSFAIFKKKKKKKTYRKLEKNVEYNEWNTLRTRWTVPDCLTSRKPEVPHKNRTEIAFSGRSPNLSKQSDFRSRTQERDVWFILFSLFSLSLPSSCLRSSFRRRKPEACVYAFAISASFYEQLLCFCSVHLLFLRRITRGWVEWKSQVNF